MTETAIVHVLEQLPPEARWWVNDLSPAARIEIGRLLRETGPANFTMHWREHKDDLAELERSFGCKL